MKAKIIIKIVKAIKIINLSILKLINKWTGIHEAKALGIKVKKIILTALLKITSGYKLPFKKTSFKASVT